MNEEWPNTKTRIIIGVEAVTAGTAFAVLVYALLGLL